jgi:hypothetical protein
MLQIETSDHKCNTRVYDGLDDNIAETVRRSADCIRANQRQTIKSIIEIGEELNKVKGLLGYGRFGEWLAAEFHWTDRTGQNFMRVAVVFGGKSETVSDLPQRTIYRLAAPSTPATLRDEVVARLEAGETLTAEVVNNLIDTARKRPTRSRSAKAPSKPGSSIEACLFRVKVSVERALLTKPKDVEHQRTVFKCVRQCLDEMERARPLSSAGAA